MYCIQLTLLFSGLIQENKENESSPVKKEPAAKTEDKEEAEPVDPYADLPSIPEATPDCFDMVSQLPWEKDIIWDGEEAKEKVLGSKSSELAGWIPTLANRHALAYYSSKGENI